MPPRDHQPHTLSDLWEKFQGDYRMKVLGESVKQSTLNRYRNAFLALLSTESQLVSKPLASLSAHDFEKFKLHRKEDGYKSHGVNTELRHLRIIINYGIKIGCIEKNPMKDVGLIKIPRQDVRFLNEMELAQLNTTLGELDLNDDYQKDAHDLVVLLLFSGARAGEISLPQFTWKCIDANKILFPRTKGDSSRVIPLTKHVNDVLESRRGISDGPFPLTSDMIANRVNYVFRRAGIENATPHTLRKIAGAYYYVATRDIFAASRFLGHSSVTITESHYVGLIQSLQVKYSNQFDSVVADTMSSVRK
jgi:integrase